MRQYDVYYDNTTRRPYSSAMTSLGNNNLPYITTQEQIKLKIHILNSDTISDVYTGFTGVNVAGSATVDNNYLWTLDGVLNSELTGSITSIAMTYTGSGYVNPIGALYLGNASGESEVVDYTAYSKVGNIYTFTVDETLTYDYEIDDVAKIQEVPLVRATSVDTTGKNTGVFEVILEADSLRFYEEIQGKSEITSCRFELLIRDSSTVLIYTIGFNFLCINIQDYTGAIPSPADPSGYYTSIEVDALLAGKANKLATGIENGIPVFDDNAELKNSTLMIDGDKLLLPISNGTGYAEFYAEEHDGVIILVKNKV